MDSTTQDPDTFWSGPVIHGRMAKIVLTQSSTERLQTFIASGLATSNFFIDSAANATVSNDRSSFMNPVPDRTPIIMANGAVVWTKEKGDIEFDGIGLLRGCYYAPDLDFNLLSVSHINMTTGLAVCFDKPYCFVMNQSGTFRHNIGNFEQGMFVARLPQSPSALPHTTTAALVVSTSPAQVISTDATTLFPVIHSGGADQLSLTVINTDQGNKNGTKANRHWMQVPYGLKLSPQIWSYIANIIQNIARMDSYTQKLVKSNDYLRGGRNTSIQLTQDSFHSDGLMTWSTDNNV